MQHRRVTREQGRTGKRRLFMNDDDEVWHLELEDKELLENDGALSAICKP